MILSPLAEALLARHWRKPDHAFYDIDILGSMFQDKAMRQLDEAYRELEAQGYLARSGTIVKFFEDFKPYYRITEEGRKYAEAAYERSKSGATVGQRP